MKDKNQGWFFKVKNEFNEKGINQKQVIGRNLTDEHLRNIWRDFKEEATEGSITPGVGQKRSVIKKSVNMTQTYRNLRSVRLQTIQIGPCD